MGEVLDHEWFCSRAEAEIAAMAARVSGADPAAPVPSCPGWTIAQLVRHTGMVHRWVTRILLTRSADRVDPRDLDLGLPSSQALYGDWLADGALPLLAALRLAGPDTAVYAWGAEQRSGWWSRRMLHETAVHRADAELAAGVAPVIDPVVAADGIEEFLTNLPFARRPREHLGSLPAGSSMHLHATDCDGEWLIRFAGGADGADGANGADGAVTWSRGHEKATVAVRGPVTALLLLTYGRIPASAQSVTVFGDAALLDTWQQKTAL